MLFATRVTTLYFLLLNIMILQFSNSTRLIVKGYNSISTGRSIQSDRTQIIPKTLRALSSVELSATNEFTEETNEEDFLSVPLKRNRVGKSLESSPVLVLNADYTPLSHAPLSLWSWQVCSSYFWRIVNHFFSTSLLRMH